MKDKVMEEVKKAFRPEFLNRLDSTVVFHALSKDHILEIVDLALKDLRKRLLEKGLVLQVTEAARTFIADKGFDPIFGARPLRRVIQDKVEDRLSEELLAGRFKPGDVVEVDIAEGEVVIHTPDKVPASAPAS
jgi:ATP-dependent Clp protease ATP-binding subunit ClpC